jgi:PAS domain S-box-containing protein
MHGSSGAHGLEFLAGGGEMGALMRAHDWARSALGAPQTWPAALRSSVAQMLASYFPMFVAWGEEMPYLYNDACIPIVGGKHPRVLGVPFAEAWPEVWETLAPMLARAYAGETVFQQDLPLTLERNGYPEATWFTFSYSPLFDETGQKRGVLSIAMETTGKVLAERRTKFQIELSDRLRSLSETGEIVRQAAELTGHALGVSQVAYAEVDSDGEHAVVECGWADGRVAGIDGRVRLDDFGPAFLGELRAGRVTWIDDATLYSRTAELGTGAFGGTGARCLLTVPLIKHDRLAAILFVQDRQPRRWIMEDALLAQHAIERICDTLERARGEAALRESEARFRTLADSAPALIWMSDDTGQITFANRHYEETFGRLSSSMHGAGWREIVHPDDVDAFAATFFDVFSRREPVSLEVRVMNGKGEVRWLRCDTTPRFDQTGRFLGYAGVNVDITAAKRAEETTREREQGLRALANTIPAFVWFAGPDGQVQYLNDRWYEYTGQTPATTLPDGWTEALHPDDVERTVEAWARARAEDVPYEVEMRYRRCDGAHRWYLARAEPTRDERGRVMRWFGTCIDIDDQKRSELHQQLLINELNHRVKNTLATVQSIAGQTLRTGQVDAGTKEALEGRIFALSRAHDVLTRENWESADLHEIVAQAVAPYRGRGENRISFAGPVLRVEPRTALALAMALQELATNAVKYGALSNDTGEVGIRWDLREMGGEPRLWLRWEEIGGPPVAPPARRGFGTRLIERSLAQDLDGSAQIEFAPAGIICTMDAVLSSRNAQV